MSTIYRLRKDNLGALTNQVFRLFTDQCGDRTVMEFGETLYGMYTVEDFMYSDDWRYWSIVDYFKTNLIPHKVEVYKAGVELSRNKFLMKGIDKAQFLDNLWTHDMSKFSANESWGYASMKSKDKTAFDLAWHHHKQHNKHHPEYWFSVGKDGSTEVIDMPRIYLLEMVADWIGAGRTYGNTIEDWLPENIGRFFFSEDTATELTYMLKALEFKAVADKNKISIIS